MRSRDVAPTSCAPVLTYDLERVSRRPRFLEYRINDDRSRRPRVLTGILENPHPAPCRRAGCVRAMDVGGTAAPRLPPEPRHFVPAARKNGSPRMAPCDRAQAIARRARVPDHASWG